MTVSQSEQQYPDVDSRPHFPALEEEILAYWERDHTFTASVEQRSPDREFVFYDGPPFANGLPHYGHLLTGFVKDAVPRYKTMQGYRVPRRFGWDCHGLPAEMEAERQKSLNRCTPYRLMATWPEMPSCRSASISAGRP